MPVYNFDNYSVTLPGQKEQIDYTLYDFQTYATAGYTGLTFFALPVGQSSKTLADTNMQLAGQLSAGNDFLLQSIHVHFYPGSAIENFDANAAQKKRNADDVYALMKSGYLTLNIQNKVYLQSGPIGMFPPANGMSASLALASNSATTGFEMGDYATMGGQPFVLQNPLKLSATQYFNVQLNWPTAVATPSGVDGRIGIVLRGILQRNAQ